MIARFADRDGIPQVIALTDPDTQLQFVIQTCTRTKSRLGLTGWQGLPFRTTHLGTRGANG